MTSRVIVAIRVAAPAERAFEVFTAEIGLWWKPNTLFSFTPRPPGRLAFEGKEGGRLIETGADGAVFEIGRILEWRPGERLAFSWRQASFAADRSTEVTVRFEAVGDETRVTVEHAGWDAIPQSHVARHGFPNTVFLQRHAEWWQALLEAMQRRAGSPH